MSNWNVYYFLLAPMVMLAAGVSLYNLLVKLTPPRRQAHADELKCFDSAAKQHDVCVGDIHSTPERTISLVVPAYNESKRLPKVHIAFSVYMYTHTAHIHVCCLFLVSCDLYKCVCVCMQSLASCDLFMCVCVCIRAITRITQMLDETLEYLDARERKQKDFTYEIIIVDDGSKDNTYELACAFAEQVS
jgi:cellulose synthase/poly-beta-1,6-N-acetylglucosamine synthase-like glycosyltransferase